MRGNQRTASNAVTKRAHKSRHPRRVLIVDDDPTQLALLERVASHSGCDPVSVETCQDAVQRIKAEQFDCIVLDLNLGDGSGIDICETLARAGTRGTVVFVSGADAMSRSAARASARSLGLAARSLPKPVDLSSFRVCLANLNKATRGLPVMHEWGGNAVDGTMERHRT